MAIDIQYEPMQTRPQQKSQPRRSQFSAHWNDTVKLLSSELKHLGASRCVIELDADRSQFRIDGSLRAQAKFNSSAVAISFKSRHGQQRYPCCTFDDWRANVRAIGKSLEALRSVDRYGVSSTGEQYKGWQQLPAPNGDHWNMIDAWRFLKTVTGIPAEKNIAEVDLVAVFRAAESKTHPDKGGNPDDFKKVQRAREMLMANA